MGWWSDFSNKVLNVLSAPARLFTGGGIIQKPVESVFGGKTGSLTPALMDVAKEVSVVDKSGRVTASSLADGILKAPMAIANFAEKEAGPALNWAEKNVGEIKQKVEKIPIIGAELGGVLGGIEGGLKETKDILGTAQEGLKAGETAVSTAKAGVQVGREFANSAQQLRTAINEKKLDEALKVGKETFEKAGKAVEIAKMSANQFGQIPTGLGLVEKPIVDPRRQTTVVQPPVTPMNPMNRSRQL